MSMQAQTLIVFIGSFAFAFMSLAFVFISPVERLLLKEWLTSGGGNEGARGDAAGAGAEAPAPKKQEEIKVPEQSFEPEADEPDASGDEDEGEEPEDEASAEAEADE